jgi:hypothetical protein
MKMKIRKGFEVGAKKSEAFHALSGMAGNYAAFRNIPKRGL